MVSKHCYDMNDNPYRFYENGRAWVTCISDFSQISSLKHKGKPYEWDPKLDILTRDHVQNMLHRYEGWGKQLIPVVLVTRKVDMWWEKRRHLLHSRQIHKSNMTLDLLKDEVDPGFNRRIMMHLHRDMQEFNTVPEVLHYYNRIKEWELWNDGEWEPEHEDYSHILQQGNMQMDHKNHIKSHLLEFQEKTFGPDQLTCRDIFNEEHHLLNMDLVYRDRGLFAERCREIWPSLDVAGFRDEWEEWYGRNR